MYGIKLKNQWFKERKELWGSIKIIIIIKIKIKIIKIKIKIKIKKKNRTTKRE